MKGPALIPAAGQSRRMGRPKLLLPLDGRPIIAHLLDSVRAGGAGPALVVVRPDDAELAAAVREAGGEVLVLGAETPDMRATVQAGLALLESHLPEHARRGFFLVPADHPTLSHDVFRALLRAADEHPERSIIVPVHGGRRGHPTWIGWSHVADLRALPADRGINAYLREHLAATLELAWPDDAVLQDLDTPADYERLQRRSNRSS
jgi:molybdenum cofactor cytidylyltransferase